MAKNHKHKSLVPQHNSSKIQETKYINKDAAFKAESRAGNEVKVFVSLRFLQYEHECFSSWTEVEMKAFWEFNRYLHDFSWQQVLEQGGKVIKVGFGYTELPRRLFPTPGFLAMISPDVDFFELRVNQKIRVHGFRDGAIFFICWLDKNHTITN